MENFVAIVAVVVDDLVVVCLFVFYWIGWKLEGVYLFVFVLKVVMGFPIISNHFQNFFHIWEFGFPILCSLFPILCSPYLVL